jgi:hypothetical protein
MTLNFIVSLAADTTFQGQIRAAAIAEALTVLAAAPTGLAAVYHARYVLAQQVIQDGCVALLQRMVWGIACTPGFAAILTDSGDANDAAIASAMVSQWTNLALVTGAQAAGD